MGAFTKGAETGTTGLKDRAALERDRRNIEQNDQMIQLLGDLLTEQRRTNQLLEWVGGRQRG
jgi:hypothetical protein